MKNNHRPRFCLSNAILVNSNCSCLLEFSGGFFSFLQGIHYWSSQKIAKDLMTVISTILIFLDGGPQ